MIGVVIWSCEQSQRVILWCEDNGPLAYARGAAAYVAQPGAFPAVGDAVVFVMETVAAAPGAAEAGAEAGIATRHARAVRVVERGAFPGIDALLRETAAAQTGAAPAAAPILPAPQPAAPRPAGLQAAVKAGPGAAGPNLRLAATG